MSEIYNTDDVIDSRDVIERIEELKGLENPTELESKELEVLLDLQEQAKDSHDWEYGESLIRYSYFEDYAQELAEDTGLMDGAHHWPLNCIDWEQAANELKYDYFSVDFDGVEYWIRA